jgi:hypothetical protein
MWAALSGRASQVTRMPFFVGGKAGWDVEDADQRDTL